MQRHRVLPTNISTSPKGRHPLGWEYSVLADNSADLADNVTSRHLLIHTVWPDGYKEPYGTPKQFEYHNDHEEIFVISGTLQFDHWFSITGPGYTQHPALWVHPTTYWSVGELTMLVKTSLDPPTRFEDIPAQWDRKEHFAHDKPSLNTGVTALEFDTLPWESLRTVAGLETGIRCKRIWDDLDDNWTTWLMEVEAGWTGSGEPASLPGGDEVFVIRGDIALDVGGPCHLSEGGYVCEPTALVSAGSAEYSGSGCLFIRWTKGADQLWDVAPAVR